MEVDSRQAALQSSAVIGINGTRQQLRALTALLLEPNPSPAFAFPAPAAHAAVATQSLLAPHSLVASKVASRATQQMIDSPSFMDSLMKKLRGEPEIPARPGSLGVLDRLQAAATKAGAGNYIAYFEKIEEELENEKDDLQDLMDDIGEKELEWKKRIDEEQEVIEEAKQAVMESIVDNSEEVKEDMLKTCGVLLEIFENHNNTVQAKTEGEEKINNMYQVVHAEMLQAIISNADEDDEDDESDVLPGMKYYNVAK